MLQRSCKTTSTRTFLRQPMRMIATSLLQHVLIKLPITSEQPADAVIGVCACVSVHARVCIKIIFILFVIDKTKQNLPSTCSYEQQRRRMAPVVEQQGKTRRKP